jgi:hypothetical protein
VPELDVVLRPYWTSGLDLVWSGQRSVRRCAPDAADAPPGDYALEAAALTGEPASAAFTLQPPTAPPSAQEGDQPDGQPDDEAADDERPNDDAASDTAGADTTDDEEPAE